MRRPVARGRSRGGASKRGSDGDDCSNGPRSPSPPSAAPAVPDVEEEEVTESIADSEAATQPRPKKSRQLSNLTDDEQEQVALFLEKNDYIFNKRKTDHTFAAKKNKAWEDLAREMRKDVKSLTTFFESIRTQMGKMRKKTSGQAAVELTERQQWIWQRFQFLVPHIGQVSRRTVQSFKTSAVNQDEEEQSQDQEAAPTSDSTENTTLTAVINKRSRTTEANTLNEELASSKDRQEKLLHILQAPPIPDVPHPERLKFAEYLGHAFQNLPQSIYREVQKNMFDLLYNAEKQADQQAAGRPAAAAATQSWQPAPGPNMIPAPSQQWQPDPSQWQLRPMSPASSVWHSQEAAWVNRQFPGYSQSPSQQDLARRRTYQPVTCSTPAPPAESQQVRISSSAGPLSQSDGSLNLSELLQDMGAMESTPLLNPVPVTSAST